MKIFYLCEIIFLSFKEDFKGKRGLALEKPISNNVLAFFSNQWMVYPAFYALNCAPDGLDVLIEVKFQTMKSGILGKYGFCVQLSHVRGEGGAREEGLKPCVT